MVHTALACTFVTSSLCSTSSQAPSIFFFKQAVMGEVIPADYAISASSLLPAEELHPIFRVPSPLRTVSPSMYTPQVVSLGPLHNPDWNPLNATHPHLPSVYREMDAFKLGALDKMAIDVNYDELVSCIKQDEQRILLDCYGGLLSKEYGDARITSDLAHVLAVDACFIAAILHSLFQESWMMMKEKMDSHEILTVSELEKNNAHFFSVYTKKLPRPVRKAILQDLLLVENQVPLLALKHVIRMESRCASYEKAEKILELYVAAFAHMVLPFSRTRKTVLLGVKNSSTDAKHLLGMMYTIVVHGGSMLPSRDFNHMYLRNPHVRNMHNATHILKFGVALKGRGHALNELSFKKGTLLIPKIHVTDDTETYFRNLIAYESCYLTDRLDILSYLHFMDFLIDTPEDVELLVECKVITEAIGSKEKVAEMWNSLCRNTMCEFSDKYLAVAKEMDEYCKSPWRRLWVEFYRSKLGKPWFLVSIVSAVGLLVMTFFTLWYTILVYEHEKKQ